MGQMPSQTPSDNELIAAYRRGDESALAELVRRHLSFVYSIGMRYLRDPHDAEDISQDVFAKMWRALPRFDESKMFKPWLGEIAKNTCLDFLKKRRTVPFSDLEYEGQEGVTSIVETIADTAVAPDVQVDQSWWRMKLQQAIATLTPAYRLVMRAHYEEGLTFREISERIKEPLNTVKSRHRRGLEGVKKVLGKITDAP